MSTFKIAIVAFFFMFLIAFVGGAKADALTEAKYEIKEFKEAYHLMEKYITLYNQLAEIMVIFLPAMKVKLYGQIILVLLYFIQFQKQEVEAYH